MSQTRGDDRRLALVAERVAPVDLWQVGEDVEAGEDADVSAQSRIPPATIESNSVSTISVDGERRVGRSLDPLVDEVELEDVAAARRDDRVHADAGEVGAEDRAARHGVSG